LLVSRWLNSTFISDIAQPGVRANRLHLVVRRSKHRVTTQLSIDQADPRSETAMSLMRDMLREESVRYADLGAHSDSFAPADALAPHSAFLVAYIDGQPVGCGALRRIDSERAEIKRMYVLPVARRQGVGRAILRDLEHLAVEFGYGAVRLETGTQIERFLCASR
jgi:GNAT superfamily N-acetyltransferase